MDYLKSRIYSGLLFLQIAVLKSIVSSILRYLGMIALADKTRFYLTKALFYRKNQSFVRRHPGLKFPPEYTVYESYRLDYEAYLLDGQESARWLIKELSGFINLSHRRILDWGCGPARIIRHLPVLLDSPNELFGTDYNENTIEWCRRNIAGVQFSVNAIAPPLHFEAGFFDAVFGISIFTHLTGQRHTEWLDELYRIIKPEGILLITTQGEAFRSILTEKERILFDGGELVERTKVKEGHRLFSAFQPVAFMYTLLTGRWKVLKFTPGVVQHWGAEQDTWILQKQS